MAGIQAARAPRSSKARKGTERSSAGVEEGTGWEEASRHGLEGRTRGHVCSPLHSFPLDCFWSRGKQITLPETGLVRLGARGRGRGIQTRRPQSWEGNCLEGRAGQGAGRNPISTETRSDCLSQVHGGGSGGEGLVGFYLCPQHLVGT